MSECQICKGKKIGVNTNWWELCKKHQLEQLKLVKGKRTKETIRRL